MKLENWQKLNDLKVKEKFQKRMKIIYTIRDFFNKEKFSEVETPILVKLPGMEPNLTPLRTEMIFGGKKQKAYLITSPEYAMKKLLCGGMEKIWQITSAFRDGEDKSFFHNPEFKILEWYEAGVDYQKIARTAEQLINFVAQKINHSEQLFYQGQKIDLTPPFQRITCEEAFLKYAKLNLRELYQNKEKFTGEAQKLGLEVELGSSTADLFFEIFLSRVEPNLPKHKPVFLFDYPAELAALSKIKAHDPLYCERFELYLGGLELGNAFSELTDPKEQETRLIKERAERRLLCKEAYQIDKSFLEALRWGMPESGGIALGVDRLVMILTDSQDISEVILFPGKEIFKA